MCALDTMLFTRGRRKIIRGGRGCEGMTLCIRMCYKMVCVSYVFGYSRDWGCCRINCCGIFSLEFVRVIPWLRFIIVSMRVWFD